MWSEVEEKGSTFNGSVEGFRKLSRIILLNSLKIELGMVTRLTTDTGNSLG